MNRETKCAAVAPTKRLTLATSRAMRAASLANTVQVAGDGWTVASQSEAGKRYEVRSGAVGLHCNCADYMRRVTDCKHIIAVTLYEQQVPMFEATTTQCLSCHRDIKDCPYGGNHPPVKSTLIIHFGDDDEIYRRIRNAADAGIEPNEADCAVLGAQRGWALIGALNRIDRLSERGLWPLEGCHEAWWKVLVDARSPAHELRCQ